VDRDVDAGSALGAGKAPPGMYRSLWPLPGGNQAYVVALEKLLPHAADQPTTHDFIGRLQQEFPQVESIATANGYIRVLVALGFVEVDSGQISLTPAGRQFVETHDVELVRAALRERVVGVNEVLDALEQEPRTMDELQAVLAEAGLAWETKAQLGWRLHWLESVGLVAIENGNYRLVEVSSLEAQSSPSPQQ
jgi:C-terminal AAA-associated domain